MDTREDLAHYAIEKKFGPAECECDGTCELAYLIAGEVHHYKTIWEKIADNHYPECPVCIAAMEERNSTACLCDKIKAANYSAEECLRCHEMAEDCKCGRKAQLV